jgi:hypothetical protein
VRIRRIQADSSNEDDSPVRCMPRKTAKVQVSSVSDTIVSFCFACLDFCLFTHQSCHSAAPYDASKYTRVSLPPLFVPFFSAHNLITARCGESPSGPSTATSETPLLDVPRSTLSSVKKKELLGVTRSLDSLNYPPEPEDTSMFDDPLKAEEVKPLRRQDYVSLGEF